MYLSSYKELIVWQKSVELVTQIYLLTNMFPKTEIYGIISQMRRAAVSIPSNIAEGYGRKSSKEYAQFYAIAYGSALELETQLIICKNLEFARVEKYVRIEALLTEILKMLHTMINHAREKTAKR